MIRNFKSESETQSFNPENLYEYINGAADAYLAYGFQQCLTKDVSYKQLKFTIDIFDMGSRINAFGMYKTERPAETKRLKIGVEAIVTPPYQCQLLKGKYYIKLNVYEKEFSEQSGSEILQLISDAIDGSNEFPEELMLLPAENKVAQSEGYNREAFLGLSVLKRCVYAKYETDGITFRYFVMLPAPNESIKQIWDGLAEKLTTMETETITVLYKKIPYQGFVAVIQKEGKVIGAAGCEDKYQLFKLLEKN